MSSMTPHLHRAISQGKPDPAIGLLPAFITDRARMIRRPAASGPTIPVPRAADLMALIDEFGPHTDSMRTAGYAVSVDAPAFAQITRLFQDRSWVPVDTAMAPNGQVFTAILEVFEEHGGAFPNRTRFLATLVVPAPDTKAKTIMHLGAPNTAPCIRQSPDGRILGWTGGPDVLPMPYGFIGLGAEIMDEYLDHISAAAVDAFEVIDSDLSRLLPLRRITENPLLRSLNSLRGEMAYQHEEAELSRKSFVNAVSAEDTYA